jgi:deazaflavin-dependent oxidoreductase (nitroreductase family)
MPAPSWVQQSIEQFHAKKGRGVGPWGDNLLLLTYKGAVSGQEMTTPLVSRRHGKDFVVVGSMGGAPNHPKWFTNLRANPDVQIEVADGDGTKRMAARARLLEAGPERDELYAYMIEVWPAFADYETRTTRKIPIVVLEPT